MSGAAYLRIGAFRHASICRDHLSREARSHNKDVEGFHRSAVRHDVVLPLGNVGHAKRDRRWRGKWHGPVVTGVSAVRPDEDHGWLRRTCTCRDSGNGDHGAGRSARWADSHVGVRRPGPREHDDDHEEAKPWSAHHSKRNDARRLSRSRRSQTLRKSQFHTPLDGVWFTYVIDRRLFHNRRLGTLHGVEAATISGVACRAGACGTSHSAGWYHPCRCGRVLEDGGWWLSLVNCRWRGCERGPRYVRDGTRGSL